MTISSGATLTRAWVSALVVVAVLVQGTIRVQNAFGCTRNVRVSEILVSAYANANAVLVGTVSI